MKTFLRDHICFVSGRIPVSWHLLMISFSLDKTGHFSSGKNPLKKLGKNFDGTKQVTGHQNTTNFNIFVTYSEYRHLKHRALLYSICFFFASLAFLFVVLKPNSPTS